jgi:hypothetical protein
MAIDLCPAGDPGFHSISQQILGRDFGEKPIANCGVRRMRTWSDERHVTDDHVEYLRQLIQAVATQNPTDGRHASIQALCLGLAVGVAISMIHGPELKYAECRVIEAASILPK